MPTAYILLGGNLGDRQKMMGAVFGQIQTFIGAVLDRSSVYETEPWGFHDQPYFLNQVLMVATELMPESLLDRIQEIETQLGRVRNGASHGARLIDIDILFYDQLVFCTNRLTIPHPRMHLRSFALTPMMELAPDFIHPVFQVPIRDLYLRIQDPLIVRKLPYRVFPIQQSNEV